MIIFWMKKQKAHKLCFHVTKVIIRKKRMKELTMKAREQLKSSIILIINYSRPNMQLVSLMSVNVHRCGLT